jgi:hypothetical protein
MRASALMPLARSKNASTRNWSIVASGSTFAFLYRRARAAMLALAASAASVGRP